MKVTNHKPQFEHPATPILDRILSDICLYHKPERLIESVGQMMTIITIDCDTRDGARVKGRSGFIIKALQRIVYGIGAAQGLNARLRLHVEWAQEKEKPVGTPPNLSYKPTKERKLLAEILDLVIKGDCLIDEITTIDSTTFTVQPFRHIDPEMAYAIKVILHTIACAKGYPRLNVEVAKLAKPL